LVYIRTAGIADSQQKGDCLESECPSRPVAAGLSNSPAEISDRAKAAEHIGLTTLQLAQQARAAGLTVVCYLLETAALTAAADAVSSQWPKEES
jgi:hypothetical protein